MENRNNPHQSLAYGIPVGLLLGTGAAVIFSLSIGLCAGIGMLLGIVVGAIADAEQQ